ncbi:hypothetical protein NL676_036709 [Syzygium grande]|nr:hypothetical protein NL676_036709 [Syzygium grande]
MDLRISVHREAVTLMAEFSCEMQNKDQAIKKAKIKRAEGEAKFKNVVDGVRQSVLGFQESVPGASAKDVMDAVLTAKYLDTMKEICASSKSDIIFIPPGARVEVGIQI